MRAAGISFFRILLPAVVISLLVTGLTFYISNVFGPYASKRSTAIAQQEYEKLQSQHSFPSITPIKIRGRDGNIKYTIEADSIDVRGSFGTMKNATIIYYQHNIPARFIYAPTAMWDPKAGTWRCSGKWFMNSLGEDTLQNMLIRANLGHAQFFVTDKDLQVTQSPEELLNPKRDPNDLTSRELRDQMEQAQRADAPPDEIRQNVGRWATRLAQRYSTPFTCLIFAFIGAPLGLRHHRTSSAVGLGVSLLIIFIFYFVSVYLSTFGDSGSLSPLVAAWTPLVLAGALGLTLTIRANS
jgi:lipopolysaccharide export system permease protein